MRDGARDDGFGSGVSDVEPEGGEAGLDVDLDFLDDVEGMGHGPATGSARSPTQPGEGMSRDDVAEFRARWADIQASFIDDPSRACEQADNLVDLVLNRLFTRERDELVRKWDRGNEPTETEDLRVAMKGYRSLIDRLLRANV